MELKNSGSCGFCSEQFTRQGMSRHLKGCTGRVEKISQIGGRGTPEIFHVFVSDRYSPWYWLHLEVQSTAPLSALDRFLRDTWLECCGHLSCFEISGVRYEYMPGDPFGFGPRPQSMRIRTEKVFEPGLKLDYEYDFGSTTELRLEILERRPGAFPKEPVALIARNHPLPHRCIRCGEPATQICPECSWDEETCFCDACAGTHDCAEEILLPAVNSPRMGVCGYCG